MSINKRNPENPNYMTHAQVEYFVGKLREKVLFFDMSEAMFGCLDRELVMVFSEFKELADSQLEYVEESQRPIYTRLIQYYMDIIKEDFAELVADKQDAVEYNVVRAKLQKYKERWFRELQF